jgi:hypothetical protein
MLPFPFWKNRCVLANCSFVAVFAAPKLAGLWHMGRIEGKGQQTAEPFCNCGPPKYSDFAVKLLPAQAVLGEGHCRLRQLQ